MLARLLLFTLLISQSALGADTYDAVFSARFDPGAGVAHVSLTISQPELRLRQLDFSAPAPRFMDFSGDGELTREADRVLWKIPADGGTLRYRARIDQKKGDAYDARITADWAILRLDNLFPAARALATGRARSRSFLELSGPDDWSFESRYGPVRERIPVATPGRRYVRPTGWLAAGKLGVRRDQFGEHRIGVVGPRRQGLRRLDTMAFLRWTLPDLLAVFPDFPPYLLVVRARDDMWRGGLSGPNSLYLHSDRPLISENATSTLLHEMVHLATGLVEGTREDWLIEGLAEFYSLEILRRSSGISDTRYEEAIARLASWARREKGRLKSPSSGADTARAAVVLHAVDRELRDAGAGTLDPLAAELINSGEVTGKHLLQLLEAALGEQSATLRNALEKYSVGKASGKTGAAP